MLVADFQVQKREVQILKIEISMPQLGLTMTEGTISAWLKKPGDAVKKDEVILTVSTDKVDMDVESTVDGVLQQIIVQESDTVPVGTPLAYIDVAGDRPVITNNSESPSPSLAESMVQDEVPRLAGSTGPYLQTAATESRSDNEDVLASPRAKRRAKQLGIDIATLKGSGPDGRIAEEDLLKAAAVQTPRAGDVDPRRQRIADRMVESITTIPAFSVSVEVNAERLVALYESLQEPIQKATGLRLTYTDLLLKALALSLASTPAMNSAWSNGALLRQTSVNLALAVATDRGVMAPVLMNVDHLPLQELVIRRSQIADKTRENQLKLTDLEGGIGTLSNLGMYNVDRFEGIISPGQTFILAAGKIRNRPWVDKSLVIKPTIILNLSVDHRVADGAVAAVLLGRLAEVIEQPHEIIEDIERK
jgi:pyruvate dehydrogenase E2 component (dihydrolipoamide acetyltransferase)